MKRIKFKMKTNKIISFFLALLIAFSVIPMCIMTASAEGGVKSKLDSFISSYPSGSRWTGSFDGGSQCYGFGKLVVYNVFGRNSSGGIRSWSYAGVSTSGMNVIGQITSYSYDNVKSLLSKAKCGDVLQFNTTKQHTMIVYSVESDGVYIYDCNWDGNCGISLRKCSFSAWSGRNSSKLTLLRSDNYDSINGVHEHSYYRGVEAAHPHKVYMKCSCGDYYYTGDTQYNDSCDECWSLNRVDVWVSNVGENAEIKDGIVQTKYQFWFKFANKNTGALYNSYGSTRGYKAKISVYNPDGSELFSYTYDDSDYNWIRATPKQIGDYKVRITLTGNVTADYWEYFTVKSDVELHFEETTSLTIIKGQSKSFQVWVTGSWPDGSTLNESIDTEIATVNQEGKTVTITGVKQGFTIYELKILDANQNVIASESRIIRVVPDSYTISYDANGGTGAPSNQTKPYGKALTLSSAKPTRSGYTFQSWNTKADGSGTMYSPGASYTANAKATLYAQWKANTYTVTYNANGGSGAPSSQTKTHEKTLTLTSAKPTRNGYIFQNWNTKADGSGTTYLSGASYTANTDVTLYAQWKANTLTINYDSNGGSVSPSSVSVTAGSSVKLPTPTKSYTITYNANNGSGAPSSQSVLLTCKGWSTSPSATSASYSCGTNYTPSANTTLYAVWNSSSSVTLSSTKPTRSGYTFLGWSTSSSASSASYQPGSTITISGNTNLYAVWKSSPTSTYTLSYNANGGSGAPSSQTGAASYTVSSTVPTRFGYTFLGWAKSSSATSASYIPGNTITLTSNTTLYAVWKSAQSVSTGNNYTVNVGFVKQEWYYKFVPSSSSDYIFESTGSIDSKVVVYKSDGTQVGSDDDSGDGSNFKVTLALTSGTTYYVKAFAYSSKTGSYTFKVTQKSASATTYTVNYNANGGSVSPSSASVTAGSSVKLPTPTKSYTITYNANGGSGAPSSQSVALTCKGWSTSSSAASASYSCGANYTPSDNTTLYAVWNSSSSVTLSSTKPTRSGYTFLGWSQNSNATAADFSSGVSVTFSGNATLYAVWKKASSTQVPDNALTVRTKSLRLDLDEVTDGFSTITVNTTNLGNCKLVVSSSSSEALNLELLDSSFEDSVLLNISTNNVKGEFIVYVRLYNESKTILYKEEQIKVSVKGTPYDTIYLDYKDTYKINDDFNASSYETDNANVATVDENGKIRVTGTGSAIITAYDEADGNVRLYKVEADYNFLQWFIIILLFGWLWYV